MRKNPGFPGKSIKKKKVKIFWKFHWGQFQRKLIYLRGEGKSTILFCKNPMKLSPRLYFTNYFYTLEIKKQPKHQQTEDRKKKLKINKYKYNHTGNVADVRMVQERHAFLLWRTGWCNRVSSATYIPIVNMFCLLIWKIYYGGII